VIYPVLHPSEAAQLCDDLGLVLGATVHRSVGWSETSESLKSLSQSPNEARVSRQKPQKHRASLMTVGMVVAIVDDCVLVEDPNLA
jgi:hypothetical protein